MLYQGPWKDVSISDALIRASVRALQRLKAGQSAVVRAAEQLWYQDENILGVCEPVKELESVVAVVARCDIDWLYR